MQCKLTSAWRIPQYAQNMLRLQTESEFVEVAGESGTFELNTPAAILTVRWGKVDGPALAQLSWKDENLEWNRSVRLGGTIAALHMMNLPGNDFGIAVITFEGQPLRPETHAYPTAERRKNVPYDVPDFYTGIDEHIEPTISTWLVNDDSPLLPAAQDAMINDARVYFYGNLSNEMQPWHKQFALPILLDGITLFNH